MSNKYPMIGKYCPQCKKTQKFEQKKKYVYCEVCKYRMELE